MPFCILTPTPDAQDSTLLPRLLRHRNHHHVKNAVHHTVLTLPSRLACHLVFSGGNSCSLIATAPSDYSFASPWNYYVMRFISVFASTTNLGINISVDHCLTYAIAG